MKTTILAALLMTVMFQSCSKSGDDDGGGTTPTTSVTVQTLMASAGKRWSLNTGSLTYYSSGGGVDSTITLNGTATPASIYFNYSSGGAGGTNFKFDVGAPLTKAMPGFGIWALNETTQKITFTCISPFCNSTDGEWKITSYTKNFLTNTEYLIIDRTLALAGGRSVKHHIEFVFP